MQHVIILGGTTPVGQFISRNLLNAGLTVTSFSEQPDERKIIHPKYKTVQGDINNILVLESVLANRYDAVINAFPVGYLTNLFYVTDTVKNMIVSMQENELNRLIFFNYGQYESYYFSHEKTGLHLWSLLERRAENRLKTNYEKLIHQSGLDFTINTFDFSFLKEHRNDKPDELIRRYFIEVAQKAKQQIVHALNMKESITLGLQESQTLVSR